MFASHQPSLLPHPGYWAKMARADVWAHNTEVEFSRSSFQNRVKIGHQGNDLWLTLPVEHREHATVGDIRIAEVNPRKLAARLDSTYRKTKYWREVRDEALGILEEVREGQPLSIANEGLIGALRPHLKVATHIITLPKTATRDPSVRNAMRTEMAGCDTYLAGPGARAYLDEAPFEERGLKVIYMGDVPEGPYSCRSVLTAFCECGEGWMEAVYGGK